MKWLASVLLTLSFVSLTTVGADKEKMKIKISGMSCAACEGKVENALKEYKGVTFVMANRKEGTATVLLDPGVDIANDTFKAFLKEKAGFDAVGFTKVN